MTITAPHPTSTRSGDAQLLFEEARRRRRRRWFVEFIVAVVAVAVTAGLLNAGGHKSPTSQVRHAPQRATTSRPSPSVGEPGVPLNRPEALAVAANGNVLISNEGSNQILERLPNGTLTSFAGNGQAGFSGDEGLATEAQLNNPQGLAVSPDGTTFVADSGNNRIRAISTTGVITTFATVVNPTALAFGPTGVLYVVDNVGVQSIGTNGAITTVIPAAGSFLPDAIAVSASDVLYVSNFLAKDLLEYSGGKLSVIGQVQGTYVTPAGLTTAPTGGIYVGNYGWFGVDRLTGAAVTPLASFTVGSLPGVHGVFRPSGVAVAPNGEVYADTDGVNGGTSQPALIGIDRDGEVHLLAAGPPTA
jgi:sugar lactone lactonase YvrE